MEINCNKCANLTDKATGCKLYGPEPTEAVKACLADQFKNYNRGLTPGEEVWVVERDECGNACEFTGYVLLAEVAGAVILTPYINDIEDLDGLLEYHIEQTAENYDTDLAVFPASDCYGTKEEAKNALEAEKEA